jgi:hypothetical protein
LGHRAHSSRKRNHEALTSFGDGNTTGGGAVAKADEVRVTAPIVFGGRDLEAVTLFAPVGVCPRKLSGGGLQHPRVAEGNVNVHGRVAKC